MQVHSGGSCSFSAARLDSDSLGLLGLLDPPPNLPDLGRALAPLDPGLSPFLPPLAFGSGTSAAASSSPSGG
eukprot:255932-Prorocentrum_minimum.AAC.1